MNKRADLSGEGELVKRVPPYKAYALREKVTTRSTDQKGGEMSPEDLLQGSCPLKGQGLQRTLVS